MTKIFLVEDDTSLLQLYAALVEHEGYQVATATNGATALGKLEKVNPDLVICDIQMPVMDGWTLLQEVRQQCKWQALPFIFMTSLASSDHQRLGQELGADDYLIKPVSHPDLITAISLRLGKQASLQALQSNDPTKNKLLLHLAAANGDLPALKELFVDVKDIDEEDQLGNTPLMFAVMMRQEETARYLISLGANPDLRHPATGMRAGAMARAMHLEI